MARSGNTVEAITARLKDILDKTTLFVVVDTLENLIKGGRIGKATGWIGTLLNIKPIAMLKNGVYTPITRVRTTSQIVKTLVSYFEEHVQGRVVRGIGVSHAGNLPLAEKLREDLNRLTPVPVRISETTPVISTHTGPGAIGFSFYTD